MIYIIFFLIVVFSVAFFIGWLCRKSFFWNWVDLIYYPLAAVGILLLFISNDLQREMFQVTQRAEAQNSLLLELKAKRPNIQVMNTEDLMSTYVEHLALVTRWVDMCRGNSIVVDPQCIAVQHLDKPTRKFLNIARARYDSFPAKLLATCKAGDAMLAEIRESNAISSIVSDKLLSQYAHAVSLNISIYDSDSITAQIREFNVGATKNGDVVDEAVLQKTDAISTILKKIRIAEIGYGEIIFRALSACISAPRKDLASLEKWETLTTSKVKEVTELEEQRERLKHSTTQHKTILWTQLNIWPFVLLLALGLKFAKGAAALMNARAKRP
ncbi:hypothetical protein [Janthinobacterium sp. 64]|uniref:hypothetical protein n=1 Tax=Janthinobacterium sp. 64 TaxID=2035208 RepID=UPI000CBEBCB3|nr:hypothetical protein [Janthinobacterium sp. 64]PKB13778.1 hypothetical protein CLU91_5391 [Janthinobacterium sp. 64]